MGRLVVHPGEVVFAQLVNGQFFDHVGPIIAPICPLVGMSTCLFVNTFGVT